MEHIKTTLGGLSPLRLTLMGGVLVGLIGFFIFLLIRVSAPDMGLLYGDLDLAESGQIVSKIETLGISVEVKGNGNQIYVPKDQVGRLRIMLAESGLPSGGSIGYEVFDRSDSLSTTGFIQDINHVRALEGELSRTIRTISGITHSRVHLVLPKRELFSRERQNASASIFIKMQGSSRLMKHQVRSIQQLVAAAVPGLLAGHISIVDDHGTLLARGDGDADSLVSSGVAEEMRRGYERDLAKNLEELLSKLLGPNHAHIEVSADIDFDRYTENAENYDPAGQVLRSSQVSEEKSTESDNATGFSPDSLQAGVEGDVQQAGESDARSSSSNRVVRTMNYEVSKINRTLVKEGGKINRISVAALVDGKRTVTPEGEEQYTALTEDEIEQINELIKTAIGFDENRNDSVRIVNMPFYQDKTIIETPVNELFFGFNQQDILRILEIVILGIVGILVLLLIVRPIVNRLLYLPSETKEDVPRLSHSESSPPMLSSQQEQDKDKQEDASLLENTGKTQENLIDIKKIEGKVKASSIKKIEDIVEKHPEEAASIVRSWLYQEG